MTIAIDRAACLIADSVYFVTKHRDLGPQASTEPPSG
jgi:hypothetical protein